MPYSKRKTESDKWEVINSDSGDVKGTHDSEAEADDQLKALYANAAPEDEKSAVQKSDAAYDFTAFIPIQKMDVARHEVWGWGVKEEPDNANEVFDYATSKPYVENWSKAAQARSGGRSLGNIRESHTVSAAGKVIFLKGDDAQKGFQMGVKVVDPVAWQKCEEGVYTGFSIGGRYEKRWTDAQGRRRYTGNPVEWSLVDAPCVKSATFDVVKADGTTELRKMIGGDGTHPLELEKAIPDAPTPTAMESVPAVPEGEDTKTPADPFKVVQMPAGDNLRELSPDSKPTADTLQPPGVKDLSADAQNFIIQFPADFQKILEQVIETSVAKAFAKLSETPSTPAERRMIAVRNHKIKVRKE